MRAVLQRVADAKVEVAGTVLGFIDRGLLIYVAVGHGDTPADIAWLADKIVNLRIFEDDAGKMNLSVRDTRGAALVISQFTLFADSRKGRRPSYSDAASPSEAQPLYESFLEALRDRGISVAAGRFQAEMDVSYTNKGPVTILLDSMKTF